MVFDHYIHLGGPAQGICNVSKLVVEKEASDWFWNRSNIDYTGISEPLSAGRESKRYLFLTWLGRDPNNLSAEQHNIYERPLSVQLSHQFDTANSDI